MFNHWFVRYPTVFTRLLPYVLQLETILDQALMVGDKVKLRSVTAISDFSVNQRKKRNV